MKSDNGFRETTHRKTVRKRKKNRTKVILLVVLFAVILLAGICFFLIRGKDQQMVEEESGQKQEESNTQNKQRGQETADDQKKIPVRQEKEPAVREPTEEEKREMQIDEFLVSMSLEDKVSQLFFICPEVLAGVDVALQVTEETRAALETYPVGGIILFSQNIESEEQLRTILSDLQAYSRYPLFLGVDEEGGPLVARIANSGIIQVPYFPNMQEIGSTNDPERAYEVGASIGGYLKSLGFNVDFAPVADIASNPENQVIGARSFGNNADLVSRMVAREVAGMQEQGVSATLKHFPGHGDTSEDSHAETAVLYKSAEELSNMEFLPFRAGIDAGADLVMTGHISVPSVTGSDVPASLSEQMITGCLRGDLRYDGIVITDSMSMGAIVNYYDPAQAAVMALQAGCDMILMPQDFYAARQAVLDAVMNQMITEERINESLRRIYRKKLITVPCPE